MHLDHQGPPVTYSEAASRPPRRVTISPNELSMCGMWVKIAACEKEKEAAWATLNWIWEQEWDKQATMKKEKEHELWRAWQREAGVSWWRKGLSGRKSIIVSEGPLDPVPILSLIPWDGVNMSGPRKTSMRVLHGLETYGVPAPWTTNNWLWGWSAHGALLRPTSRLGKMFKFACWHPTSWRPTTIRSTMTPIRNWTSKSMWYCSMPTLCNTYPSAMTPGIRTVRHQQSKTSGQRLLSLLEVGLYAT